MPVPARKFSALSVVAFAILLGACSALQKRSSSPALMLTVSSAPEAYNLALQAMKARDYASAVRHLAHADSIAPFFAPIILQKARAHVQYGDTAGALRELDRLSALGYAGDLAADSLLKPFASLPGFRQTAARAAQNAAPIISSDTSFIIHEAGVGVEGMTHWTAPDGITSFYMGAMKSGSGRILRIDSKTSAAHELVAATRGTFMGMHPDSRNRLWVAHTQVDTIAGVPRRRSGIRSYSLTTGELIREYPFTDAARDHWFNDLAVATDGRVYVTDSDAGIVYALDAESGSFNALVPASFDIAGPNGITLSRGEHVLYVSALEGIFRVDTRTANRMRLSHPNGMSAGYSDGLYACGSGLIGVQTVGDYARVVLFQLNRKGDAIVSAKVLERRHPEFRSPSTGTVMGDEFHYIARRGKLNRAGADSSSALVLRLPLHQLCA